jgi:hypothetical protein
MLGRWRNAFPLFMQFDKLRIHSLFIDTIGQKMSYSYKNMIRSLANGKKDGRSTPAVFRLLMVFERPIDIVAFIL